MFYTVKALLKLRHEEEDLQADGIFEPVLAESGKLPFVYRRGKLLLALNPSTEGTEVQLPSGEEVIFSIGGAELSGNSLTLDSQSFAVIR